MRTYEVTEPYIDQSFDLSEGPFWEKEANVLRFTDIVNNKVYRVNLNEGPSSLKTLSYDHSISFTGELEGHSDSFIYGGKYGVGISSKDDGETKPLAQFWSKEELKNGKKEKMRANDGAVDSKGRFWVSAVCDPELTSFAPEAVLFRLDLDGTLNRVEEGMTIPNGMSWSQDNKILYLADTKDCAIYKYDFDAETGSISNKRVFFKTEEGTGPDGHAQDAEGNIWTAVWGTWKVVRLSPEGEVTAEVKLPTRCITAVAFGGEDLYVTSEKDPEPEKYPESVKYQGRVFKCHVGVTGKPSHKAIVKLDD